LESGADAIISVDDDNVPMLEVDFFSEHSVVTAESAEMEVVSSSTGWYNACSLLNMEPAVRVYPRGYPFTGRGLEESYDYSVKRVAVHGNMGLWLGDPDLDAVTWIAAPCRAVSYSGRSVALADDTWAPVNTQNTCVSRASLVAFYQIPMGVAESGFSIERYGDIFGGYFYEACVKHMKGTVRVGRPVVLQNRNAHDYLRDLCGELAGMIVVDGILEFLRAARLDGRSYAEAYVCLCHLLEDEIERWRETGQTRGVKAYFHRVAYCMRRWVAACRATGGV
jgi:hypothetical protein